MVIGVLKEPSFESRVSALPEVVSALHKKNIDVIVETGAGDLAFTSDEAYINAGGLVAERSEVIQKASILLAIHPPSDVMGQIFSGKVMIGVYQPLFNFAIMKSWAATGLTTFSLDSLPRTSRAQSMDVLSSQANIAGYKAVLFAANQYCRYLPMFMTAAGSIPPAKVLILGAGVAGLQAIATARRLGCVVEVFDTRPAVKEEVMSLGAKFVEVEGAADPSTAGGYAVEQDESFQQRQRDRIGESIAKADIVITTAQIPGRRAPVLVTREMISRMRKGSLIIDLAAATGGNTECTKNNETVVVDGVLITGNSSLPSTMPFDASKLYGKNVTNFLSLIINGEGGLNLNFEDDLIKGSCITHAGEIVNERVHALLTAVAE